ncbi:hypothetical protein FA15DRAFT_758444 [Coprinopsis marcescibilis]|uniref:Fungal-type protein kinase domain-containing protein n=1 Tax=Coprinopsis marcescibilis TaxID=230819 RepID=A0A5C3KN29_COPMA|nr:hypothetical protein FA15DRAFT_758444 [Coprinopsis marcescibilis]
MDSSNWSHYSSLDYDYSHLEDSSDNMSASSFDKRLTTTNPILRQRIKGCSTNDIGIPVFAEHILGVDKHTVEKILAHKWDLDARKLRDLAYYIDNAQETSMYKPFFDLCEPLLAAVLRFVEPATVAVSDNATDPTSYADVFWNTQTQLDAFNNEFKLPEHRYLKPDGAMVKAPKPAFYDHKASWKTIQRAAEFKSLINYEALNCIKDIPEPLNYEYPSLNNENKRNRKSDTCIPSNESLGLASQSIASTGLTSIAEESEQARTGSKRKRSEGPGSFATGEAKRTRRTNNNTMTAEKIQLANYAIECLTGSCRVWTTGLSINKLNIAFSYFDRMLVLQSPWFNIVQNPELLALLLYAMYQNDLRGISGFNPFQRPWSVLTPEESITDDMKKELEYPTQKLVGSFFEFPTIIEEEEVKKTAWDSFEVTKVILLTPALVGRVTAVLQVKARLSTKPGETLVLALKISWQPGRVRIGELDIIKHLSKTLDKKWHDHLPCVYFDRVCDIHELGLPWLNIPGMPDRLMKDKTFNCYSERGMHVIAGRLCSELWRVDSAEEFFIVWLHCVKCLYASYSEGKVLHRDLSENNLLFWRKETEDSVGQVSSEIKGVLNDWDMASFVEEVQVSEPTANQQTGTLPFMALELLDSPHTRHLLRHDLESLFCILVWGACHYNFGESDLAKRRKETKHTRLAQWTSRDMTSVMTWKNTLLTKGTKGVIWSAIQKAIPNEFSDINVKKIIPLFRLFTKAYKKQVSQDDDDDDEEGTSLEENPLDKLITYETFMSAIGEGLDL